jgi:hypothetical protein
MLGMLIFKKIIKFEIRKKSCEGERFKAFLNLSLSKEN